jgi:hypothetical protein
MQSKSNQSMVTGEGPAKEMSRDEGKKSRVQGRDIEGGKLRIRDYSHERC